MYLASSLLEHDYEVKVIDLGAKYWHYDIDRTVDEICSYQPEIIGFTLYTASARFAYELVSRFKSGKSKKDCLLVAGGPHTSAVPEEPLQHGFDISIRGEGENTLNELLGFSEGKNQLSEIKGISLKNSSGNIHHNKARPLIEDLDALPLPVYSLNLFDPRWYFKNGNMTGIPASILSSRGCPSKCTFCANIVTGRRFRFRSTDNVIKEMMHYHKNYGTTFFSFLDDSFTSNIKQTSELCERFIQLRKSEGIDLQWSCITRYRSTMVVHHQVR
jgi:anaerobic magnesium-protoporphyrin IX monomethyl ester cyclase